MTGGAKTVPDGKHCWIGTSGYIYDDWHGGVFYPKDIPQKKRFEYYASQFSTVELNVTFYRLPEKKIFRSWYERSPEGFLFFVKGSRLITHMKKLKGVHEPLGRFFESVSELKEKLAGVLWQFPPMFEKDLAILEAFLGELAKQPKTRHVFEFRHASWFDDETKQLLTRYGAVFCRADWPEFSARFQSAVAEPFVYLRRHGVTDKKKYSADYSDAFLRREAQFIRKKLKKHKEVFVFFNNDFGGRAPRDARKLISFLQTQPEGAAHSHESPVQARHA